MPGGFWSSQWLSANKVRSQWLPGRVRSPTNLLQAAHLSWKTFIVCASARTLPKPFATIMTV